MLSFKSVLFLKYVKFQRCVKFLKFVKSRTLSLSVGVLGMCACPLILWANLHSMSDVVNITSAHFTFLGPFDGAQFRPMKYFSHVKRHNIFMKAILGEKSMEGE